jgi:hypothetical protein
MWSYDSVSLLEQFGGIWYATLVFVHTDGRRTSSYMNFGQFQPTDRHFKAAGDNEAKLMTMREAPAANLDDSISQQEFFNRFTISEVATIYAAAQINPTVMAYIKRMELSPRVHKDNPDLLAGLPLLEAAQLIAPGRAAQILNW